MVTISKGSLPKPTDDLGRWIGPLAGWQLPEGLRSQATVKPAWNKYTNTCELTFGAAGRESDTLELSRRMRLTLGNCRLVIVAANDGEGSGGYEIKVLADGRECESTGVGNANTSGTAWKRPVEREYILGHLAGREVELKLVLEQSGSKRQPPTGIDWRSIAFLPLIENLPESGQPLVPDVLLTSLTPVEVKQSGKPAKLALEPGRIPTRQPLKIRGVSFVAGFGTPTLSEITYALEPGWTRLVAVIGLADGSAAVGPYQVLLDGQVHWQSSARLFDRYSPGLQIDVPIPPGHRTITLKTLGNKSVGAWADAGFIARQ